MCRAVFIYSDVENVQILLPTIKQWTVEFVQILHPTIKQWAVEFVQILHPTIKQWAVEFVQILHPTITQWTVECCRRERKRKQGPLVYRQLCQVIQACVQQYLTHSNSMSPIGQQIHSLPHCLSILIGG